MKNEATLARAPSDIAGLDDILRGGFPRNYVHLLSGLPGTGKTTLALQFLRAGAARGERCLYVTLSETRSEVEAAARTHGWDLAGIEIAELAPSERKLSADSQLTVFNPSELEIGETTEALIAAAERVAGRAIAPGSAQSRVSGDVRRSPAGLRRAVRRPC